MSCAWERVVLGLLGRKALLARVVWLRDLRAVSFFGLVRHGEITGQDDDGISAKLWVVKADGSIAVKANVVCTKSITMEAIPGINTTKRTVTAGSGDAEVEAGNTVTVHATGVVKETNKKFWSTKDPGQQPFTYQAGVGGVITGWDKGCLGMKVGEVRELVIPAAEGYGAGGFPAWGIPPGGTLTFTLECLAIVD